ncbi:MAG: alpha-D-ribose 1-methylphosphonate 5-triphosphate diphosphatase, partial [Proteobacteria bacterium]|nr:alpha-D-ribose 1-methylphosphonate 5-triphosphate diphosphatase [Pseudomonadota bacterium]
MQFVLRSTRVLIRESIRPADIVIHHDLIEDVLPFQSVSGGYDLGNMLIAPGIVDLHSDAIEKEIEPRPGAHFPIRSSVIELDKKLTMAGITTMYHAVAFNDEAITKNRGTETAARIIRRINEADRNQLGVDNLVHARYELTSFASVPVIKELIESGAVHILSVMDHTPGQGQFKSIENWKKFHLPVYDLSDSEADLIIEQKQRDKLRSYEVVSDLLRFAGECGLMLLSHDDDSPEKIDLIADLGIRVSEFPLDKDVAAYARDKGIATGMGAPNVVRGQSQSGNVSARELVRAGVCDFLCSDYHPSSMLQAPYLLHNELQMPLVDAFRMVTATPAALAGLNDRGEIGSG